MNVIVAKQSNFVADLQHPIQVATNSRTAIGIVDPLDGDRPEDEIVITTRRAICRVVLVATETAGRFQRECLQFDPMSWMLAPRALFDGASAIDACLGLEQCIRGILIHGLSLGLDADPAVIDALAADSEDGATESKAGGGAGNILPFVRPSDPERRLFTATVVSRDIGETVQAFHASLAVDEAEVAGRLYSRIGAASAEARIVDGFDERDPVVSALVSPAICDTLKLIAADPASSLASDIDVNIEQRFFD